MGGAITEIYLALNIVIGEHPAHAFMAHVRRNDGIVSHQGGINAVNQIVAAGPTGNPIMNFPFQVRVGILSRKPTVGATCPSTRQISGMSRSAETTVADRMVVGASRIWAKP